MQHIYILSGKFCSPTEEKQEQTQQSPPSPNSVSWVTAPFCGAQEYAFVTPRSYSPAWKKIITILSALFATMTLCLEQQLSSRVHTCTFDSERFVFIQVSLYYELCLRDHQFFKNYLYKGHCLAWDICLWNWLSSIKCLSFFKHVRNV